MNKYYVYNVQDSELSDGERKHAFVDEVYTKEFANTKYDAKLMTFTGIMVEADSPNDASMIYNYPSKFQGEYSMVDEPKDVVNARTKHALPDLIASLKKLEQRAATVTASAMALKIAHKMIEINKIMGDMAKTITVISEGLTEEQLYERIKQQYVNQLKNDFKHGDPI